MAAPNAARTSAHDIAASLTSLMDDEARDAVRALTAHLEAAHATYTDAHAALMDDYRTATQLFAGLVFELANPGVAADPSDSRIDAIDRRLIELLGEGKKRHTLHTDVGIGPREVRTRLERLYDMTGSQTQFQFARACVSRGWLPADPGTPRRTP